MNAKRGRYLLTVVYPDGNPMTITRFHRLSSALIILDVLTLVRTRSELFFVTDDDEPERGRLDWDDVPVPVGIDA